MPGRSGRARSRPQLLDSEAVAGDCPSVREAGVDELTSEDLDEPVKDEDDSQREAAQGEENLLHPHRRPQVGRRARVRYMIRRPEEDLCGAGRQGQ